MHDNIICSVRNRFIALCCSRCLNPTGALYCLQAGTALCLVSCPSLALPSWSPQSTPSTTAPMLAFQAFHLAAYHFAQGTFQPTATSSARGCSELDSLLGGGPGPVDLNAALDVCFDAQFKCSHAKVQRLRRGRG